MNKRNLFDELMQGVEDLQQQRQQKITLKTTKVKELPQLDITAAEIREIREKLGVSRPVFAKLLRMNPRSVERWEQDKGHPDQGNITLLRLVKEHPETVELIANL